MICYGGCLRSVPVCLPCTSPHLLEARLTPRRKLLLQKEEKEETKKKKEETVLSVLPPPSVPFLGAKVH